MEPTETLIKPAPVFDLDPEAIGSALRILPAIAVRVGHKSVKSTLAYSADVTPEGEFVNDVLTMTLGEVVAKWYGGELNAGRFAAEVAAAAMERVRGK